MEQPYDFFIMKYLFFPLFCKPTHKLPSLSGKNAFVIHLKTLLFTIVISCYCEKIEKILYIEHIHKKREDKPPPSSK